MPRGPLPATIIPTIFSILLLCTLSFAGNVIVRNGQLNVSAGIYSDSDTFYIDSENNRVGIGTTNPTAKLDVAGIAHLGVNASGSYLSVAPYDSSGFSYISARETPSLPGTTKMILQTFNASVSRNALAIDNEGNVGIGTASPQRLFTVADSIPIVGFKDTDDDEGWAIWDAGDYFGLYEYTATDWDSGSNRFAIKEGGNVGIGTTSPEAKLHISSSPGNAAQLIVQDTGTVGSGGSGIAWYNNFSHANSRNWAIAQGVVVYGDFSIRQSNALGGNPFSAGTDRIYINNNGNVGIGTTSPEAKLEVSGSFDADDWYHDKNIVNHADSGYSTHEYYLLLAKENSSDKLIGRIYGSRGGATAIPRPFEVHVTIDTSSAYSPSAAITGYWVRGTNDVSLAEVDYSGDHWWALKIDNGTNIHSDYFHFDGLRVVTDTTNWMKIVRDDDADLTVLSTSEVRYVDDNIYTYKNGSVYLRDNVGIGTNTPVGKLTVYTGTSGDSPLVSEMTPGSIVFGNVGSGSAAPAITGRSNNNVGLYLRAATVNSLTGGDMWFNVREDDNTDFATLTSPAYKFTRYASDLVTILRNGNVGIGTTTPELALDVEGDIEIGTGTTGCVRDSDNTTIAGTCSSDIRLKTDVQTLENVLENVSRLRPVTFKWIGGNVTEYGLIAQEVREIMPELVSEDDEGYLRVSYDSKLFMLMLESIRELKEENDDLKEVVCMDHPEAEFCNPEDGGDET